MNHHVTVDRFGRIVIPKPVRDRLGLEPGTVLEIDEDPRGVRLTLLNQEQPVMVKDGFLVYCGTPTGDIEGAVERERRRRIQALGGMPSE